MQMLVLHGRKVRRRRQVIRFTLALKVHLNKSISKQDRRIGFGRSSRVGRSKFDYGPSSQGIHDHLGQSAKLFKVRSYHRFDRGFRWNPLDHEIGRDSGWVVWVVWVPRMVRRAVRLGSSSWVRDGVYSTTIAVSTPATLGVRSIQGDESIGLCGGIRMLLTGGGEHGHTILTTLPWGKRRSCRSQLRPKLLLRWLLLLSFLSMIDLSPIDAQ